MHDQGVEAGPSLGLEYPGHGEAVAGIGAKAVDRFGREGDQRACREMLRRAGDPGGVGRKQFGLCHAVRSNDAAFRLKAVALRFTLRQYHCIQAPCVFAKVAADVRAGGEDP